jgi:hypothetical protein
MCTELFKENGALDRVMWRKETWFVQELYPAKITGQVLGLNFKGGGPDRSIKEN